MAMQKSKLILLIVFILGLSVALIGGISAYLSDMNVAYNTFSFPTDNKIDIVENFDPPKELKPGTTFTKEVKIQNTGDTSCYVRIRAEFTDSEMEELCEVDWNTQDFVFNEKDGYWYYTKPLDINESTPNLFTTVQIQENAPEASMKGFDILVYAESYQSSGYTTYQQAWDAFSKNKPSMGS